MATASLDPDRIWISAETGETKATAFVVRHAPATSNLRASLVGANGVVKLTHVSVKERVLRPMTEDEIMELPARPPSIREQARRSDDWQ